MGNEYTNVCKSLQRGVSKILFSHGRAKRYYVDFNSKWTRSVRPPVIYASRNSTNSLPQQNFSRRTMFIGFQVLIFTPSMQLTLYDGFILRLYHWDQNTVSYLRMRLKQTMANAVTCISLGSFSILITFLLGREATDLFLKLPTFCVYSLCEFLSQCVHFKLTFIKYSHCWYLIFHDSFSLNNRMIVWPLCT